MSGSSRQAGHPDPVNHPTQTTIPAYGVEFFEYRRRCFLAGLPLPTPPHTPRSGSLPEAYTVPLPLPEPIPPLPNNPSPATSSVGRLEALLQEPGAEETVEAWKAGLQGVHARLEGGKRLSKPLRLGLVIKVLKAGWIMDGTWPVDPKTKRAAIPPSSPFMDGIQPLESRRPAPDPPARAKKGSTSIASQQPRTPIPDLADLPALHDAILPDPTMMYTESTPAKARATATAGPALISVKNHDSERDVKVGGNVWRGAKADPAIPIGSVGDHG